MREDKLITEFPALLGHLTFVLCQEETDLTTDEEEEDKEGPASSGVLGKATINKYFTAFRDAIGMEMLENYDVKIGGPNCTVEIDESMFGKVLVI